MKVKVIGGSDAFSYHNSSFLITLKAAPDYYKEEVTILFDCGPNAFHYCKDNEIVPDAVYISHTHFDHIGGLEQLAYWASFVMGQTLNVVAAPPVNEELRELFINIGNSYDNGKLIDREVLELFDTFEQANAYNGCSIFDTEQYDFEYVEANHVVKLCFGLLIADKKAEHKLLITGDTKASKIITETIMRSHHQGCKITIFHDYQGKCNPFESVHCCEKDFELYYGDLPMRSWTKWYLYHNEEFNKQYKGKEIDIC